MLKLRPHQEQMVKFVYNKLKTTFIFGDVGVGKTAFSLQLANQNPDKKFLILVHKKSMINEWEREQINFYGKLLPNVKIVAYTTKITPCETDILIVDEIHKLKSMNFRFLNVFRYIEFNKLICLTATPIDSLNDLSFYIFLSSNEYLKALSKTSNELQKAKKVLTDYKKQFKKEFRPITQKATKTDATGKVTEFNEIVGFYKKGRENIKEIFSKRALFVRNFEVLDDVFEMSVKNFIPIKLEVDNKEIEKEIEKEKERRESVNEDNAWDVVLYEEAKSKINSIRRQKQIAKDKEIIDYELLELLNDKEKMHLKELEKQKSKIFADVMPSGKWINDKAKELFDIDQMKLQHLERNSIVVYFFKSSEKFLEDNLENFTRDPYEFIKGDFDYLITHASTIAEGINGLQTKTNKVLFWDYQQSRLRVEQLIGRLNRTKLIEKPEFKYFNDSGVENENWQKTFNKLTLQKYLKSI